MNKLIEAANKQSTEIILATITIIGGGMVNKEMRMVRAALIEVYQQRKGEDAADQLMESLGM